MNRYKSLLPAVILVLCCASLAFADDFTSSTGETHALSLTSGTASYSDVNVTKTGDATVSSDSDTGYNSTGSNAAVFAKGGAKLTITGTSSTITSNSLGGHAVFSYGGKSGDGTKITISDTTITTTSGDSSGLMVTGGGIINATNLTVTTSGSSSSAIRSGKGGGTITVTGGTYTATARTLRPS